VAKDPALLGQPLTYIRHQRGWTLEDVAELVKRRSGLNMAVHRQKVWRWENNQAVPELPAQIALAEELGIPTATVHNQPWPVWLLAYDGYGRVDQWTPQTALQSMAGCMDAITDRRSFLLFSGEAAVAMAAAWAGIPAAKVERAAGGGRVDDEVADWIEGRIVQLWHLDDMVGGDGCLHLAQADLKLVHRLLERGRYSGDVEQRLYRSAGEILRFAGWSAFDAHQHAAAERYWHAGLRSSATSGDVMTGAYILSQMSLQRTYAGDGHTAVNLLETARDKIGPGASRTVHAMIDAWQVRAHVVAGEAPQAMRVLNRADTHWEHRDPGEDPPWAYWMRRPSLIVEVSMSLSELGKPDTAVRLLEERIAERQPGMVRTSALALTALANARLTGNDLDGALDTASRALTSVVDLGSNRVADQLHAFAQRLPTSSATSEFRELLADMAA
jgi:transcriptional regulator with XRE-family HTH domain